MRSTKHNQAAGKLPGSFEALVQLMPPRAIMNDVQHENTLEMIDRMLASGKLTEGQEIYLETLVQLVEAYEATHHAIKAPTGIDVLAHLLAEHSINASGLARILGIHESMGAKILNGEQSLTVDHIKRLAAKFNVRADVFL